MDVHHHDTASHDAAGLSVMMMALFAFVVGLLLLVALVAWAPWSGDDDAGGGPVDQPNAEENAPDVDIEGDIDVDGGEGGEAPQGQ